MLLSLQQLLGWFVPVRLLVPAGGMGLAAAPELCSPSQSCTRQQLRSKQELSAPAQGCCRTQLLSNGPKASAAAGAGATAGAGEEGRELQPWALSRGWGCLNPSHLQHPGAVGLSPAPGEGCSNCYTKMSPLGQGFARAEAGDWHHPAGC